MPRHLSKQELEEAEECFSVFSKNGHLLLEDLAVTLRSLGFNPSNQEVEALVKDLNTPSVTFDGFKEILKKDLPKLSSVEEVREAFGLFDRDGTGTIPARELKHVLMSLGEKLSEAEVDLLLQEAFVNADGEVTYEHIVRAMTMK